MDSKVKKLSVTGMLCAAAYGAAAVGRIPLVLFLKYDPKDVVIAIGGFLFGPLTSFSIAFVVSLLEMLTISETGILGFLMNVISSCSFACPAAWLYRRKGRLPGALAGLLCGWGCMAGTMLLWNYLITPIYMGYPREAVVKLLLPAFLPFNLIKGGLNSAITMLLYQPVTGALRQSRLIGPAPDGGKLHPNPGVILGALLILAACIWLVPAWQGPR